MQRLEVSGAVRPIYGSLGVKRLKSGRIRGILHEYTGWAKSRYTVIILYYILYTVYLLLAHLVYMYFLFTLALPILLYGSETWTIQASDARRITAAEMKYMRRTAGYTCTDYKTNAQIAKELKNNTNFGQITVIQEKLDTTCK